MRSKNNNTSPIIAQTDAPADEDKLQVSNYVEALAGYVKACATPMTIAIQGDWGSGKTSLMNMVDRELRNTNCRVVKFNTWQYSQFNMGDDLILALIEHLIDEVGLNQKDADAKARKAGLKALLRHLMFRGGSALVSEFARTIPLGSLVVDGAQGMISEISDAVKAQQDLTESLYRGKAKAVETLRGDLESYVSEALNAWREDSELNFAPDARLVVMIDDLDRLPPERAVEVMEALKVFLEIKHCVYILAIDFDVVKQGIKHKFGEEFSERKAISFFDKIIQVPFYMPVNAYDIDDFLIESLGISDTSLGMPFIQLAKASVGNNPRSLKRLANTFQLLRTISTSSDASDLGSLQETRIFAVLCMQAAYPLYYRDFASHVIHISVTSDKDDPDMESFFRTQEQFFQELAILEFKVDAPEEDPNILEYKKRQSRARLNSWGMTELEGLRFKGFLSEFYEKFTAEGDDKIDSEALENSIRRAAVTSIGSGSESVEPASVVSYGIDNVRDILKVRLEQANADLNSLEIFTRVYKALEEKIPTGQVNVGVGKNRQAQIYSDSLRVKRGTLCEATMNNVGCTIRFGKNYHEKEKLDEWRAIVKKHFELSRKEAHAGNFQISIMNVKELKAEALRELVDVLTEVHRLTRQYFFESA